MTIKSNIEAKRAEKQRQINEEAKLLKLKKQYNQQLLPYLNAEQIINNKSKCECIKSQHSIEKERKMILAQERKRKLRAEKTIRRISIEGGSRREKKQKRTRRNRIGETIEDNNTNTAE